MAYNYDYPYVDTGRQNADWMLKNMKEFAEELKRLAEIVDTFDITKAEVEEMIEAASVILKAYTDAKIDEYDLNRMRPYVQSAIDSYNLIIRTYIDRQDEAFFLSQSNRTDSIAEDLKTYIDNKVINILNMENPVTGEYETIPEVIDYIVETFHRENALTAGVYDGYELTANAYDSQLISAFAYDFDGANQVVH